MLSLSCGLAGIAALAVVPQAGAASQGYQPAATALAKYVKHTFPGARQRFVNCPGNNRIGNGQGIACEFRLIRRHRIVRGRATTRPRNPGSASTAWFVATFRAQRPLPMRSRRCSTHGTGGRTRGQRPISLTVLGRSCFEARRVARSISSSALTSGNLRIPRRFTVTDSAPHTLGFITTRLACRGRVKVLEPPGFENPFGRETARCATRFGDRLTFVFDQHS